MTIVKFRKVVAVVAVIVKLCGMVVLGCASSGNAKSTVTPPPRNDKVVSGKASTLHINPENKSVTLKKKIIFLARIELQINNYSKRIFIVN